MNKWTNVAKVPKLDIAKTRIEITQFLKRHGLEDSNPDQASVAVELESGSVPVQDSSSPWYIFQFLVNEFGYVL